MKKLFMLLVLLGMAGAAGYIYWEKQAKQIEVRVAEAIRQFNAEVKAQTGLEAISYHSLSITGFPYSLTLQLKDPVIRLPLSYWFRDTNPRQSWVEEHRFKGTLSLGADWKVTRYTLRLPKERTSVSYIGNRSYFGRKATALEAPSCSMSLDLIESFEHLWQPQKMLDALAQDLSLVKALECELQGYQELASDVSAEPMQKLQNLSFTLGIDKAKGSTALDSSLDMKLEKFQAYAANDVYHTALLQTFPSLIAYTRYKEFGLNALAFLGEQNLQVQATYTGETLTPEWGSRSHLQVKQFQLDNGLGNYHGHFTLNNQPLEGGTKREITLDAQIHATIATLLEKVLQQRFAASLSQSPAIIGYNLFYIDTGQLPRNQMAAMAAELYPQLNARSPFDFTAKVKTHLIPPTIKGGFPQQLKAMIEDMVLQSSRWKMGVQGQVEYNPMLLLPTLDATLSIQDGDAVFKEMMAQLVMMEKWRQRQANRPAPLITDALLRDVHRIVEAIAKGQQENLSADPASLGNPKFHVEFKNFMPRINELDINQIMLLFNELLSVHLNAGEPEENVVPPAQYQPR